MQSPLPASIPDSTMATNKENDQTAKEIRGLNASFLNYISKCVKEDCFVDLSKVNLEYNEYLSRIGNELKKKDLGPLPESSQKLPLTMNFGVQGTVMDKKDPETKSNIFSTSQSTVKTTKEDQKLTFGWENTDSETKINSFASLPPKVVDQPLAFGFQTANVAKPSFEFQSDKVQGTLETPSFGFQASTTTDMPSFNFQASKNIDTPSGKKLEAPSFNFQASKTTPAPAFSFQSGKTADIPSFGFQAGKNTDTPSGTSTTFSFQTGKTTPGPAFSFQSAKSSDTPSDATPTFRFQDGKSDPLKSPTFSFPNTANDQNSALFSSVTVPTFSSNGYSSIAAGAADANKGDEEDEVEPEEQVGDALMAGNAGEEGEVTLYSVRSKVRKFVNGAWEVIGLGLLKVNQSQSSKASRIIMRSESGKVLLNVSIFSGMSVSLKENTSVNFCASISAGSLTTVSAKVKEKQDAVALVDAIEKAKVTS